MRRKKSKKQDDQKFFHRINFRNNQTRTIVTVKDIQIKCL